MPVENLLVYRNILIYGTPKFCYAVYEKVPVTGRFSTGTFFRSGLWHRLDLEMTATKFVYLYQPLIIHMKL